MYLVKISQDKKEKRIWIVIFIILIVINIVISSTQTFSLNWLPDLQVHI
jgi:hypothetical protein